MVVRNLLNIFQIFRVNASFCGWFFVKYTLGNNNLTIERGKKMDTEITEENKENLEEEHSNIEFTIDVKFHGFTKGDEEVTLGGTSLFKVIFQFIEDNEILSENYFEIWSMKRDWSTNGYDVKFYLRCCPHCFYEQMENGFNETVTYPHYSKDNKDLISSVELIGYSSKGN